MEWPKGVHCSTFCSSPAKAKDARLFSNGLVYQSWNRTHAGGWIFKFAHLQCFLLYFINHIRAVGWGEGRISYLFRKLCITERILFSRDLYLTSNLKLRQICHISYIMFSKNCMKNFSSPVWTFSDCFCFLIIIESSQFLGVQTNMCLVLMQAKNMCEQVILTLLAIKVIQKKLVLVGQG